MNPHSETVDLVMWAAIKASCSCVRCPDNYLAVADIPTLKGEQFSLIRSHEIGGRGRRWAVRGGIGGQQTLCPVTSEAVQLHATNRPDERL